MHCDEAESSVNHQSSRKQGEGARRRIFIVTRLHVTLIVARFACVPECPVAVLHCIVQPGDYYFEMIERRQGAGAGCREGRAGDRMAWQGRGVPVVHMQ